MGAPVDGAKGRDARLREVTHAARSALDNKILLAIPESEYRLLENSLEPFEFRQHQILHEPNQKLEFAYFPNGGLMSLVVTTEDGKTVEVGMVGNEGVAGVGAAFGLAVSPLRHVVQVPGNGLRIKASALQNRNASAAKLQIALSRYSVILGMLVAQTAACNRLHDSRQRLARWLLMAADRVGSKSLPMTHDFLATILGTDRPSVSVAAKILQTKRIIGYRRGTLEILSRKKLENSVCECYKVVQQFNRVLGLE